jgi:hypothetical protein
MRSQWDQGAALGGSEFLFLKPVSYANLDSLSYMEMRLIMGKLLWHNDIVSAGGNERWNPEGEYRNMRVYNNWMKAPFYVKLIPRKD